MEILRLKKKNLLVEEINHEEYIDQILENEILNPLLEKFPQFKKEQQEEGEKKEIPSIFHSAIVKWKSECLSQLIDYTTKLVQVPTEIIERKKEEKSLKRKLPIDNSVKKAPKKNRPGQRERREGWKKKYGNEANHLQKNKLKQEKSDSLHPSWQAKQSQQQSIVSFKGTKKVFSDE